MIPIGEPNNGPRTEPVSGPVGQLLRMRRSAHRFLVGPAPTCLALLEGSGGQMLMPPSLPDAAGAEPVERLAALAADEATRLGRAELFAFDPDATAAAASYGARLQTSAPADTVPGATIATHGIVPPAPAGFLRWATPITRPGQTPIIGVHWGRITTPATAGVWLVLWSDLSTMLVQELADTSAPSWLTPQLARTMLDGHGSAFYDTATFLQDPDVPDAPRSAADPRPAAFPFTHLRGLPLTALPADQLDPDATLTYIVLASWALLTADPDQPAPPPHLIRRTVPAREAEADRQAGLPPARPITMVTAPTLRPTDPLPAGLDNDVHHLRMRIYALAAPDAPDGPTPDEVIADLLCRYEAEVVLMAAYHSSRQLLHALADEPHTSPKAALDLILSVLSPGKPMPFDLQAWTALPHLLLPAHQEPALPPAGIAPADLLWALGAFQACALMRVAGNQNRSDRSNTTAPAPTGKRTKKSRSRKARKKRR